MIQRRLIVTHHAPDLDAIGSVWLLKRFDTDIYADAPISFVNPGETISRTAAEQMGFSLEMVTHVDTGLGEFDHHQADRARLWISASSLVFEYLKSISPHLLNDSALISLVDYITEIDKFGEIAWPDPAHWRYSLMIHELIRGLEFQNPYDDLALLNFGLQCLDAGYSSLKQNLKAYEVLAHKSVVFELKSGNAIAVESRNDDTMKIAQKQGYILIVRKDPKLGHIRVKVRPDSDIELRPLYDLIIKKDRTGTWYYHQSGKMLLNGSDKHRNQVPSPLSLNEVVGIIKSIYG